MMNKKKSIHAYLNQKKTEHTFLLCCKYLYLQLQVVEFYQYIFLLVYQIFLQETNSCQIGIYSIHKILLALLWMYIL